MSLVSADIFVCTYDLTNIKKKRKKSINYIKHGDPFCFHRSYHHQAVATTTTRDEATKDDDVSSGEDKERHC